MGKNYIHRGTYIAVLILTFVGFSVFAQVGIGTTNPNENALLDIDASTRAGGLLLPRVALVSANSPAPLVNPVPAGMTVYNIATSGTGANEVTPGFYYHNGTNWVRIGAAGDDGPNDKWKLTGNTGTSPGTNFIGTLDNVAFQVRTNNSARFDFTNNGRLRSFNDGDAAQPTYSWNGANGQNMGMFRAGSNGIGFSTNNVERFRIAQGNQVHAMHNGTAAAPFYSWASYSTMGMYGIGSNILGFSTASQERMRILDNGNVGIGMNNPSQRLEITGNLRLNGALMPNGQPGTADKILLSKGANTSPQWGPGFLNTTQISNIGKYYVGPITSNSLTYLRLAVADPNMTIDTSVSYNFIGNLPNGPRYGYDISLLAESRNGEIIFHLSNFSSYNLSGLQIVYTAFYH